MKKCKTTNSKSGTAGAGSSAASATTPEAIMESMKCPVCTELLLSPIYQCERGHNICSICIEEVHECPLCKGDYGDTRNYFAEELVNSMTFPCKYAEYGCPKTILGSLLKDHQENCEFQPYRCPELACQELIGLGQMAQHLERHGFHIIEGETHIATIDIQDKHFDAKTEYNPWRIRTFSQEFYTVATRQRDKNWYFWAWVLTLPKNAKKYSCEIILSSANKEVIWRGPVHSLRLPPEDIIKGANALVLTDQIIKAMRDSNGKITCKVRFIHGKNWDRETGATKKDKKALLHLKKEGKKGAKGTKVVKSPLMPALPTLKRSQSITSAISAIKKLSKASVGSSSTPSSSRQLPLKGKTSTPPTTGGSTGNGQPKKPSVSDAEQSLVLKMRASLTCPGCNESISPPIYVCTVGHSVCESCRKKLSSSCPLCRCPVTGTRNFFAEELLYKTVQKCRFHTSGCDVALPAVQIKLHEDSCDFAPFECPFSTCRKVFDPNDLLEHMKTHDLTVVNDELNMSIPFPKATGAPMCAIPSILMIQGIAFYPLLMRETNGAWAFWVASASGEANNFAYEVRIKKQSKLLAFQGRVMSLRHNPNQIVLRGEGLITTEKAIKTFKVQENFEFSLKIAPVKNFAKSGVAFLTPLCSGSKCELLTNGSATKTELFANKRTSKEAKQRYRGDDDDDDDDEGDDMLLFAQMRRRNTYADLFADEDTDGDDDAMLTALASSPDSRSSHNSPKKAKSGSSISSGDFVDEDCSEEIKAIQRMIAETSQMNVVFTAVEQPATPVETPEQKVLSPKESKSKLKPEDKPRPIACVKKDEDKKALPTKKKSALKLKEKTSQRDLLNLKESPSTKKVEFSPTAQVYLPKSIEEQDRMNNNWLQDEESEDDVQVTGHVEVVNPPKESQADPELVSSASVPTLLATNPDPTEVKVQPNPSLDQIRPTAVKSSDSVKFQSKLEVFSRSCLEIKNCGNRDIMRSRMQQLSKSLLVAIQEVDEEQHEMEEDAAEKTSEVKWVEVTKNSEKVTEKGESRDEEETLTSSDPKKSSENLIDLASDPAVPKNFCPEKNSLAMGEFDGPIELIIRTEDKVASISLSNLTKKDSTLSVRGSTSDGGPLSSFNMEIPVMVAESSEEIVEESDAACQVGDSLMHLATEETRGLYGAQSVMQLDLGQSYDTVAEGFTSTFQSVKNIISGMIPQKPKLAAIEDQATGGDKEEEEIEEVFLSYVNPAPVARLPPNYGL